MSRKHNTRHSRARSRYPERLRRRGQTSATVRMADLETLRARQSRYANMAAVAAAIETDGEDLA
jgi:hypothetical protein